MQVKTSLFKITLKALSHELHLQKIDSDSFQLIVCMSGIQLKTKNESFITYKPRPSRSPVPLPYSLAGFMLPLTLVIMQTRIQPPPTPSSLQSWTWLVHHAECCQDFNPAYQEHQHITVLTANLVL